MGNSILIARLIGPVLSVIGLGMLTNSAVYHQMAGQFLAGYPFIYFSGILLLVTGLAILNSHHAWTPDWRSVITAIGWIVTGIGTFRIIAPQLVTFVAGSIIAHSGFFIGAGVVLLTLGGFITFKGYVAEAPRPNRRHGHEHPRP
jgi:hypothetical protein